jgi:hypothetical protein
MPGFDDRKFGMMIAKNQTLQKCFAALQVVMCCTTEQKPIGEAGGRLASRLLGWLCISHLGQSIYVPFLENT